MRGSAALLLLLFGCSDSSDSPDAGADTDGGAPLDAGIHRDAGPTASDAEPPRDAGPPATCDVEGEMRAVACGNCGLAQERCEAGVWVRAACLAERECSPGSVETEALGMCEDRSRICDMECGWSDWTTTSEAGDCEPGDTRGVETAECSDGTEERQECSDECIWVGAGECTPICGDLRSDPAEVCVGPGDFYRGDGVAPNNPVTRVTLTYPYAIDTFPVSKRRFLECVAADACDDLGEASEASITDVRFWEGSEFMDAPMRSVTWEQADQFCRWDGRRLPTQAEWEKAARGPFPRDNRFTWGGDESPWPCDTIWNSDLPDCGSFDGDDLPIGTFAGVPSFYGMEEVHGRAGAEYVLDRTPRPVDDAYLSSAESREDPFGPASGEGHVMIGIGFATTFGEGISHRGVVLDTEIGSAAYFRCARAIE